MITFTNQASLSYNNTVTNSNITTGQIVELLSVTKTALLETYRAGDNVTYIISIINSGSTPYTALTLTDNLGGYEVGNSTVYPLSYVEGSVRYFVNGTLQNAPAVADTAPLTLTGLTVPAGGNATIVYEATVTDFAPLASGSTIVNEVNISSPVLPSPVGDTETITVEDEPMLTISKSLSPTIVPENGTITYTFVIQNHGNTAAVATDNAVIRDVFNPVLRNISVYFNGEEWSAPTNYTYNEATGEFVTVIGEVTVPAATYTQDPATGVITVDPGVSVLTITGTI